ncbi:MAG: hypothetical protein NVS3B5_12500 [Sphingomicrobium sp.]
MSPYAKWHPHREADGSLTLMQSEDQLRDKLRKIEALYAGARLPVRSQLPVPRQNASGSNLQMPAKKNGPRS